MYIFMYAHWHQKRKKEEKTAALCPLGSYLSRLQNVLMLTSFSVHSISEYI